MDDRKARLTAYVHGHVQGVGFRFWVQAQAAEFGLVGSAANLPEGTVEVVAEGSQEACQRLLDALRGPDPPGRVSQVCPEWSSPRGDMAKFIAR